MPTKKKVELPEEMTTPLEAQESQTEENITASPAEGAPDDTCDTSLSQTETDSAEADDPSAGIPDGALNEPTESQTEVKRPRRRKKTEQEPSQSDTEPETAPNAKEDGVDAAPKPKRKRTYTKPSVSVLSIDDRPTVETEADKAKNDLLDLIESQRSGRILTGTIQGVEQSADNPRHAFAVLYHGEFKVIIPAAEAVEPPEDYRGRDPDLVVTAWHATEKDLQVRYSSGDIRAKDGKLYFNDHKTRATWDVPESGKRKVYFAVGNCLIGNVNNTKESMAIAWMNGSNATTMIGYVVTTWHGRNGWGGLKYWLTNPGRYSLAEAVYMNQQDFLYQQYQWYPSLIKENYPTFEGNEFQLAGQKVAEAIKGQPTQDQIGFWHDRDVLAYYGDPLWNVRLQEIPEETDFTVTSKVKGKKCIITIKTKENFSLERMKGDKFKQEHVLDLPFSYFFPERLNNPRLAAGQDWRAVVDENFLIIYNPDFKPNMTYEVVLDIDK